MECLCAFSGDVFVFVGEPAGGCTADGTFYQALDHSWSLVDSRERIMDGASDESQHSDVIYIYRRKQNQTQHKGAG
eukprot:scaffold605_cov400-Prasinococcus_capsulatus_cf.AAC.5